MNPFENHVDIVFNDDLMPNRHKQYLKKIQDVNPNVIYDIGSCVLHWTRPARAVWPNSKIICFDVIEEVRHLYNNYEYYCYALSDKDNEEKIFYKNLIHLGGQSLYKENSKINPNADIFFGKKNEVKVITYTLDTIVKKHNLPLPNLIKIDVQGSELDIIIGAKNTICDCTDIILELQEVDYNLGAPKAPEVIRYMESIGYKCIAEKFSKNKFDADYHFRKII